MGWGRGTISCDVPQSGGTSGCGGIWWHPCSDKVRLIVFCLIRWAYPKQGVRVLHLQDGGLRLQHWCHHAAAIVTHPNQALEGRLTAHQIVAVCRLLAEGTPAACCSAAEALTQIATTSDVRCRLIVRAGALPHLKPMLQPESSPISLLWAARLLKALAQVSTSSGIYEGSGAWGGSVPYAYAAACEQPNHPLFSSPP